MSRNIIKLQGGSTRIEKELVSKRKRNEQEELVRKRLISESLGLGMSIVLPIVGGIILGAALDKIFGTAPKLTLGLLFLGVFISFIKIYNITQIKEIK